MPLSHPDAPAAVDPSVLLSVDRLHKKFGDKTILDAISLDIRRGETAVLIGPPGSGKTTVLRSLIFLEIPAGGTLRLGGERIGGTAGEPAVSEPPLARQRLRFGF